MTMQDTGCKMQDSGCKSLSCIVNRESCVGSHHASRITRHAGFTLVELLITMAVFVFVIAAATSLFVPLLTQFKQQAKMAETNIEGIVGLEIMRRDIQHAGYGLPWVIPTAVAYNEATTTTYNDCSGTAPCNPPRAVVSGNNTGTNGSDYLIIKAANVANNTASSTWTNLIYSSSACVSGSPYPPFGTNTNVCKRSWTPATENPDYLGANPYVIVITPGTGTTARTLSANGSAFTAQFSSLASAFLPTSATDDIRFVYGVDPTTALRMPFNRADYSISTSNLPSRCAQGTGVLTKTVISQANGGTTNALPLLDCVADMQVVYQLDMNDDGTIGTQSNANGSTVAGPESASAASVQATLADPSLLRQRLKEVRVYILAHEGQKDATYTSASSITVGEFGLGSTVSIGTNWQNYRWKIYTLVVKPMDLNK